MPPLSTRKILTAFLTVAFCAAALGMTLLLSAAEKGKAGKPAGSQYDVPEGTPGELLDFIKKQQNSEPSGTTRRERMEHLRRTCDAIVTAAEKIIQGEADDQTVAAAAKAAFEALGILERLGDEEAAEKVKTIDKQLRQDKRPAVANLLALHALNQRAQKLDTRDARAVERYVADVKELAASEEADALISTPARTAMVLLYNADSKEEATHLGRELAQKFLKSDRHDALAAAAQIAKLTGRMLELEGAEKEAASFYRMTVEGLAKDDSPTVREVVEEMEYFLGKFALVGKPMPISGRRVDGREFDISDFEGKVVLVDFWATWCKPCVEEIPNVKEVYEKYHDRGFEVVGISIDSDADALKEFLRDEHIPWTILFEPDGETHPMAEKYGVMSVPLPVLIDRQGRVVAISARGERLGELVEKLINDKSAAAGKKAG